LDGDVAVLDLWAGHGARPHEAAAWRLSLSRDWHALWAAATGETAQVPCLDARPREEPPHFHRAFAGRFFLRAVSDPSPNSTIHSSSSVPPPPHPPPSSSSSLSSSSSSSSSLLPTSSPLTERSSQRRLLFHIRNGFAAEAAAPTELNSSDVYLLLLRGGAAGGTASTTDGGEVGDGSQEVAEHTTSSLWIWVGEQAGEAAQAEGAALAARLMEVEKVDPATRCHIVLSKRRADVWAGKTVRPEAAFWDAAWGLAVHSTVHSADKRGGAARQAARAAAAAGPVVYVLDPQPGGEGSFFAVRGVRPRQHHFGEAALLVVDDGGRSIYLWAGRRVSPRHAALAHQVCVQWAEATAAAAAHRRHASKALPRTYSSYAPATKAHPSSTAGPTATQPSPAAAAAGTKGLPRTYSTHAPSASMSGVFGSREVHLGVDEEGRNGCEEDDDADDAGGRREVRLIRHSEEPPEFCALFHGWCRWGSFGRTAAADPWETRVESRNPKDGHFALGRVLDPDSVAS
jgi:hypothetical protein